MFKNFRIYSITIVLSTILGCGSSNSFTQKGSSTTFISLRFEFLDQLKDLCSASYIQSNYPSKELYNKDVSSCVFSHLNSVGVTAPTVKSFQDEHCTDPIAPEFVSACEIINSGGL